LQIFFCNRLKHLQDGINQFFLYPLWVAHYNAPDKPRIGRDWTFWQHSEAGHINGITSLVDCDVFNGDSTNFKKLLLP